MTKVIKSELSQKQGKSQVCVLGSSVITEGQDPLELHCSAFQRQLRDCFRHFPQMISKQVSETGNLCMELVET